jgi:glycosyltransferase involved in cell wall biosynthesis
MRTDHSTTPLITIVTATWNRENTIAQCMDSVARQTYPHIQHVVIDGRSTDRTAEIARPLLLPGGTLISEPDKGIYDALNKGIGIARGDVVGFLHADDFFAADDVIEKIARAFQSRAVAAVYGDLDYISADDPNRIVRRWRSGEFSPNKLRWGWMPPHPTLYVQRSVYEKIGGFDTSYRIAADYLSMLQMFKSPQFAAAYIPEVLIKMRTGGVSNRSVRNIAIKMKEDLRALRSTSTGTLGGIGTLLGKNLGKISQLR